MYIYIVSDNGSGNETCRPKIKMQSFNRAHVTLHEILSVININIISYDISMELLISLGQLHV